MCDNSEMVTCEICGREFKDLIGLSKHIGLVHKIINCKDYYDKYFKKEGEDICNNKNCHNLTRFISLVAGYTKHCGRKCSYENPRKSTETFKCEVCDRKFKGRIGLMTHVSQSKDHPNVYDYKRYFLDSDNIIICKICGKRCDGLKGLSQHISLLKSTHGVQKLYYDKYLRKSGEGICKFPGCDNETTYVGFHYLNYCCLDHYYKSKECSKNCSKAIYTAMFKDPEVVERYMNRDRSELFKPYTEKFFDLGYRQEIKDQQNNIDPISGEKLLKDAHLHHINYDKGCDDREILIFLNQPCHAKTNFDRDYWKHILLNINKLIIEENLNLYEGINLYI
jgi:hypothetical protein